MATGKRIALYVRQKAVQHINAGETSPELIAKVHKVNVATVKKWIREIGNSKDYVSTGPSADVKDSIAFLEMAEKAVIEDLVTRKRKRMTKAETYMLLALNTLRG